MADNRSVAGEARANRMQPLTRRRDAHPQQQKSLTPSSQIVHPTTLSLAASVIGQELACFALVKATSAWRREKAPADLAMGVAAGLWLLHLVVLTVMVLIDTQPALVTARCQCGCSGIDFRGGRVVGAQREGRQSSHVAGLARVCGRGDGGLGLAYRPNRQIC